MGSGGPKRRRKAAGQQENEMREKDVPNTMCLKNARKTKKPWQTDVAPCEVATRTAATTGQPAFATRN